MAACDSSHTVTPEIPASSFWRFTRCCSIALTAFAWIPSALSDSTKRFSSLPANGNRATSGG